MFILIAFLVLGFLIIVHELGHFAAAKLSGMPVDEFSLGFGPCIISRQWGETRYSLRVLPLGGYNRIAGMEPNDDRPDGFNRKPLGSRMAVILAGSVANFLVAALLFVLTFSIIGYPVATNANLIGEVLQGSPAEQIGLKSGDRIVMVDGMETTSWEEVAAAIHGKGERQITVTVERLGASHEYRVTPSYDPGQQISTIGISPDITWERQGFLASISNGVRSSFVLARTILDAVGMMVTGQVAISNFAGPVGVVLQIGDQARSGAGKLLVYTGLLGLNLAIINLLPFPALDGSRIVFLLLEGLRGKPINPEKEGIIHLVGFALLMGLVLLITYNDIMRLFAGG
jgi:regulator of sigma E protease